MKKINKKLSKQLVATCEEIDQACGELLEELFTDVNYYEENPEFYVAAHLYQGQNNANFMRRHVEDGESRLSPVRDIEDKRAFVGLVQDLLVERGDDLHGVESLNDAIDRLELLARDLPENKMDSITV